jgi:hypothetical protein
MHLRRVRLVALAAPFLFAACSSDGSAGNGAPVPPFGSTEVPATPEVVENPSTESPDTTTPDLGGGGSNNEGQDPDTQLEQPGDGLDGEPGDGDPTDPGGPVLPAAPVENRGADCVVPPLPAGSTLPVNPNLPDPFTRLDGTRITRKSDWTCRRQEILQQVYQYIYGAKPVKPDSVTGTVSTTQITVDIQHDGQNESFTASVSVPPGEGPFPAVVSFSGSGPVQQMSAMGVAVITFNQGAVGSRNSGIFGRLYGNNSAGDLAAWAWGASRIVDVIQAADSSIIDVSRLAVTGCSFLGKAAFATGALDERFALTVPLESGIGGVPSYKIVPELEPNPSGAGDGPEQPQHAINNGWLPGNSLVNDFGRLPVDTHEIIGLVAPRGLLVLGNTGGGGQYYKNLDFRSEYATVVAGKEIFAALGVPTNLSYDSRSVNHCQNTDRFSAAVESSVDRFLLGGDSTTGELTTDFEGTRTSPEPWVDWTTPTLEGELP